MFFNRLFARGRTHKLIAHELYKALVDQARKPVFYEDHQVPDNLDGRFDMILLHLFLILNRFSHMEGLNAAEKERNLDIQTQLQEIMFSDMDQALRELGVGDMGVGKRIRQMAEATFGRLKAYEEALNSEAADQKLAEAIERNVFRGVPDGRANATWLAGYLQKQRQFLAGQPFADLMAATPAFAPAN